MTHPRLAVPDFDSLQRRLAALDARLDGHDPGAAARDALKGDIVLLFRETDYALRQLVALKEEVKTLAAKWKSLPHPPAAGDDAPDGDGPPGARPSDAAGAPRDDILALAGVSARVDHLGASTFIAKGWSAISTGEYGRAEEALVRAVELAPGDPEACALLGWALAAQRREAEAIALLGELLERDPMNGLARVSLGLAHLERGSYGEAIEHLARAARDDDRKAALYAHFYLGLVYQRREMYDDAVTFFRRALTLGPNLLEAYYEMGRAHWLGGDRDAALTAWRAGAAASKFSAWAKRCEGLRVAAEQGGDPLAA